MTIKIPFHIPFISDNEILYLEKSIENRKLSGDGYFTRYVQDFLEAKYHFKKVLLTTSCTDAIEMATHLFNIMPEDEIILPSFTFVSTANPFVLRGAKLVFMDSSDETPNVTLKEIKRLTTTKTKCIVLVHYAAQASSDLMEIKNFAKKNNIFLLEDAAQCIGAKYNDDIYLGSIGDIGTISFHDTKNIHCGEGGCIVINNKNLIERAEIIWEKGTNRKEFLDGKIEKYEWVDLGSSYLMSEINASFLAAQLPYIDNVNNKRNRLSARYSINLEELKGKSHINYPITTSNQNGHIFYIILPNEKTRKNLILYLKENSISTAFHYQSLHRSHYFISKYIGKDLPNADRYSACLLRLPLYYDMHLSAVDEVCAQIHQFFNNDRSSSTID